VLVIAAMAWRGGLRRTAGQTRALAEEVEEPILRALRAVRSPHARAAMGSALALAVAQDAEEVRRERLAVARAEEMAADRLEVRVEIG